MIDVFRPLPVVINDVYKSFFDSVYDESVNFSVDCYYCIALYFNNAMQ